MVMSECIASYFAELSYLDHTRIASHALRAHDVHDGILIYIRGHVGQVKACNDELGDRWYSRYKQILP